MFKNFYSGFWIISFFVATVRIFSQEHCNTCVISIPKSGTHLLMKTLSLLTNKTPRALPNNYYLDRESIEKIIPQHYLLTHLIYDEVNKLQILANNIKVVLIIRDPRDMIISFAYFIPKIRVWADLNNLPINDLISLLINRVAYILGTVRESDGTGTIDDLYRVNYLKWISKPYVFVTTFEKLIGATGGGDDELQLKEIQEIADFLGYHITIHDGEQIAKKLFGDTNTFREGKIGSWKTHFTDKHKEAFKEIAGQLLIDLGYETDFEW